MIPVTADPKFETEMASKKLRLESVHGEPLPVERQAISWLVVLDDDVNISWMP